MRIQLFDRNKEIVTLSLDSVFFFLAPHPSNSLSLLHSWPQIFHFRRTLRARGTVESWLYNVELAMYETVKM